MPAIVHKVHDNSDGVAGGYGFSDLQLDSIATALAGLRADIRDEMQAAIATAVAQLRDENDMRETVFELKGKVDALVNLIGGNGNDVKLFEASETVMQRKVKVQDALRRREKPVNQRP